MVFISILLPRVLWIRICGVLGGLSYYLSSKSRDITITNLTMVYGDAKSQAEIIQMAKRVFVMMGRNAGEVIRSFNLKTMAEFDKIREIHGEHYLQEAYDRGKGVIFLVAHIGAFELMATEMALRGYKPFIIGTPLKDERLNDLLWRQRGKLGATAIERGKETVRLLKNLMSGGTLAILIDQDTRVKSRFINFFGKPCATPIGATILAMKTGAAVIPTFIHMRDDLKQEINCYPQIEMTITGDEEHDLIVNTQKMNDIIEAEVRKYPEQWVWMHERWKTKPGEEIR